MPYIIMATPHSTDRFRAYRYIHNFLRDAEHSDLYMFADCAKNYTIRGKLIVPVFTTTEDFKIIIHAIESYVEKRVSCLDLLNEYKEIMDRLFKDKEFVNMILEFFANQIDGYVHGTVDINGPVNVRTEGNDMLSVSIEGNGSGRTIVGYPRIE